MFTCLHDYLKALQLLTMCLCVPAVAISAVMIAAYKKFILVSLLKYGKVQLQWSHKQLVKSSFIGYFSSTMCWSVCGTFV